MCINFQHIFTEGMCTIVLDGIKSIGKVIRWAIGTLHIVMIVLCVLVRVLSEKSDFGCYTYVATKVVML